MGSSGAASTASTGVVTLLAVTSTISWLASYSVRNCYSKPSSSTYTKGGTVFVTFPVALDVPFVVFTVLLTNCMASVCPLSISKGSGCLLQNWVSDWWSHLHAPALLVCLLDSAISSAILQNLLYLCINLSKWILITFAVILWKTQLSPHLLFPSYSANSMNVP